VHANRGSTSDSRTSSAQPSPTIAQCLNGGLGWLKVECNDCKTRASLPLDGSHRRQAEERLDILYP
jgi:hypothetical protein